MDGQNKLKKDLKKGLSLDVGRRRREEKSLAIRKEKKEESLLKRRNIVITEFGQQDSVDDDTQNIADEANGATADDFLAKTKFNITDIPKLMMGIHSSDPEIQVKCLRGFRKLLSSEQNPPVQACIDCGVIPFFVECLRNVENPSLQFEAAWALTNIASTDRTRVIVECNAIPHLVQLLESCNPELREQCAWCLGNVAGDGPELRDLVLSYNALEPLVKNVTHPDNINLLRNCTWALSNFCRGKPVPNLNVIAPALPALAQVLLCNDNDTIIGKCFDTTNIIK
jgi:hypothetical protein